MIEMSTDPDPYAPLAKQVAENSVLEQKLMICTSCIFQMLAVYFLSTDAYVFVPCVTGVTPALAAPS